MEKKIVGVVAAAAIAGIMLTLIFGPSERSERSQAYHVMLADPRLYKDGIFSDTFHIRGGAYEFRFVPNGDSPKTLSISLKGDRFSFAEDFRLEGTLHETGISRYYTWDYLGDSTITIPEDQELEISINPHGDVMGPVSVYLIK